MESLREISPYLDCKSRLDLKAVACQHVLGNKYFNTFLILPYDLILI